MNYRLLILILFLLILTVACAEDDPVTGSDSGSNEGSAAAIAVEAYLTAAVDGDIESVLQVACREQEARARSQVASFSSMNPELVDMSCQETGEADNARIISCSGKLKSNYATGENFERDLQTYRVVEEDGVWKYCGEAVAAETGGADVTGDAVQAVSRYLAILVQSPALDELTPLSCEGRTIAIQDEIASYSNIQELRDLNCQIIEEDRDGTRVQCTGELITDADPKTVTLDSVYYAFQEDEQWRYCGRFQGEL